MKIDVNKLFSEGTQVIQKEHEEAEKLKEGVLRGGSSGALILGGKPIGTCPRLAYGRFMGIQFKDSPPEERELMFSAGRRNEDSWYETLTKSYPASQIKREEELGISHTIKTNKSSYEITGRPDLVLLDKKKNPILGLELKLLCSLWTAKSVLVDREPKTDHLIQAGFYSWKLGIPFDIWYTSHVEWAIPCDAPKGNKKRDWRAHLFPKPGETNSQFIDYTWYKESSSNSFGWEKVKASDSVTQEEALKKRYLGIPRRILPFRFGFETSWQNGQLSYRIHGTQQWAVTAITQKGIEEFYASVLAAVEQDQLPPRASGLRMDGDKANYSPCDYCPLEKVCSSYKGSSVKEWLDIIQKDSL